MTQGIALDCGWLIGLDEQDFDGLYSAFQLVERMCDQGVSLLLDHEGRILAEYGRYFDEHKHARRILAKLLKNSPQYISGTPSRRCLEVLDRDGFDPADRPYIGVAENGKGVYVTHEQKHLEAQTCQSCLEGCGVQILGSSSVATLLVAT